MRRRCTRIVGSVLFAIVLSAGISAVWADEPAPEEDAAFVTQFAILPTDHDTESTLALARELAEGGREILAVDLLLPLLDAGAGGYVRDAAGVFRAAHEEGVRLLAGMSAEALAHYRLHADPRLLRMTGSLASQREEATLREAVYRYFLATEGDQAAWILAGLYLNRGAYRAAIRLLEELLHVYPDSRIPPDRIHLRLAIAHAAVGDMEGAHAAWEQVTRPARHLPDGVSPGRFRETLTTLAHEVPVVRHTPVPWGRGGTASGQPGEGTARDSSGGEALSFAWMARLPVDPVSYQVIHHNQFWPEWLEYLEHQLRTVDWRPTEQIHLAGDMLYLHSYPALLALDMHTGTVRWTQNAPAVDMQRYRHQGYFYPTPPWVPSGARDIWSFGSRVDKELLVTADTIYRVENLVNTSLQLPLQMHRAQQRSSNANEEARPLPSSSLVALERESGAVRWRLDRIPRPLTDPVTDAALDMGKDGPAPIDGVDGGEARGADEDADATDPHLYRFPGTPILLEDLLLLPVEEQDGLSLLAVDAADGTVRWRRTLCLYYANSLPPWHGVRMLRQGNDVYVATGMGLVFLLEGQTGRIHWVRSYPRSDIHNRGMSGRHPHHNLQVKTHPDGSMHAEHAGGWEENELVLTRNTLVLIPSDAGALLGFDATTGDLKWTRPQEEERYLVGTEGGRLFVAGRFRMRAIDMQDGTVAWTQAVPRSLGRGLVTGGTVYLPTDSALTPFDAETGEPGAAIPVPMQGEGEVLNLSTNGDYLFVAGLDRVWAFAPERVHLPRLHQRADAGAPDAIAARGLYLARNEKLAEAVEDLWTGWNRLPPEHDLRGECGRYLQRYYLARAEETGDESILENVYKVAGERDAFRIRAQVQAAIHLRHGRLAEAMGVFLALGVRGEGTSDDLPLPSFSDLFDYGDSPLFQQSILAIAHAELESIRARFPDDAPEAREAAARTWLQRLRAGDPDPEPLLRLAFLLPETAAGLEARHRAGRMLSREGYPELAREAYLACTASADPGLRVAGTAYLADLAAAWGWQRDATRSWGEILAFHPDATIPWLGRQERAHALASTTLRTLAAPPAAAPQSARTSSAPPDTLLWSQVQVIPQPFVDRGRYPSEFRRDHAILADPHNGNARCVRLQDGAVRWELGVARSRSPIGRNQGQGNPGQQDAQQIMMLTTHRNPFQYLHQLHESDLLPFHQGNGLETFGTVTGGFHDLRPRYWRYEVASNHLLNILIRQGVVAFQYRQQETNQQYLTVLCSVTGVPLWSRMQLRQATGALLIGGDHLLQVDANLPQGGIRVIQPYRLADGTMEEQLVIGGDETLIAFSDRGLLIHAPDAIRLQPYVAHREGWRLELPEELRRNEWALLPLSENMTCLYSMGAGRILVLKLDGTRMWTADAGGRGSIEGIDFASDGSSVNVKWSKDDQPVLVQYDVMTGAVLSDRSMPEGVRFPLSIAGRSPWIPFARPDPDHRNANIMSNEIGILDKRTGAVVSTIEIPKAMTQGGHMNQLYLGQNFNMNLQDDFFIIQTQTSILVYHTPEDPEAEEEPDSDTDADSPPPEFRAFRGFARGGRGDGSATGCEGGDKHSRIAGNDP